MISSTNKPLAQVRMLSAFRTVATTTLEVEAHIFPTHLHVRHRAQRTIANLHTLPREHPMWSTLARAQRRRNNIGSYARFPLAEALKTMDLQRINELETIDNRPTATGTMASRSLRKDRNRFRRRSSKGPSRGHPLNFRHCRLFGRVGT